MLRDWWFYKLAQYRGHQLVFLDESGINRKLGDRDYGYSPKGRRIPQKVAPGRAENYSLLPAMSIDGYIMCKLYHGVIDSERYKDFIRNDVLPQCTPFPEP
jgi:hypothetical protein